VRIDKLGVAKTRMTYNKAILDYRESRSSISQHAAEIASKMTSHDVLLLLLNHLGEHHGFGIDEIKRMLAVQQQEIMIPVYIFSRKISCLEAVVKYLSEVLKIKNAKIAILLKRDIRTIWTTYQNAIKKEPELFMLKEEKIFIPLSLLAERKYSVLEIIAKHLKDSYGFTFHEIAEFLERDDSTIWTVYNRFKLKGRDDSANGLDDNSGYNNSHEDNIGIRKINSQTDQQKRGSK
jgi:DNA-binding transcriptional MerR regulator